MKTKVKTIRLNAETLDFLQEIAFKENITHPISDTIPNITQTICEIIKCYKIIDHCGGSFNDINKKEMQLKLKNIFI